MFAFGAAPAYWPNSGSELERSPPSPAMRPATIVPWPYGSPALVAFGLTTADAITRDVESLCETSKSGRLPCTPESITATPTPVPVACFQRFWVLADWLNQVAM